MMKNAHNTIKSIVVTRIDNRSKKREGGKKKEEWKDGNGSQQVCLFVVSSVTSLDFVNTGYTCREARSVNR